MSESSYQKALDFLYSFVDYSVERSYRYSADVFDLSRVLAFLALLGDPHKQFKSIHIAGTKGKGSVSALIDSSLRTAGYRTGLYTSPHLLSFTERIRVQGSEISKREVVELVQEIKPYTEKVPGLTTYELITTLAFMHFARQNLDCAVIEVGLGGRLDATNVITPLVSVITSISYDHMHLLGNSLSDIAFEKAGIIKPEVPVIISPQQYEVKGVLTAIAKERGAPLYQVGKDWLFSHGRHDMNGQSLYLWSVVEQPLMTSFVESAGTEEWVPPRYEIPLLGYHQVINAATAYGALRIINKLGLKVDDRDIRSGFRQVSWPGRFQVLSKKPTLIVDSAHNRDSALKLRIALDDYFPGQPIKLIFGASADKDISGMLTELLPRVSRMIVTQADHPRAMTPEQLAELAHGYGIRLKEVVPVSEALNLALRNSYEDEVILATGSIFVVGEVLSAWKQIKESAESQIASGVR